MPDPGTAPPVSREEALAYLDDFVARPDARMAAANTPLPTADNAAEVIAEVTANVDFAAAAAAFSSDEEADEEDEGEGEEGEEEEGAEGAAS